MGQSQTSKTQNGNVITFETQPFAEGSIRYAFRGSIVSGPDKGDKAVVKVFKREPLRKNYIDAKDQLKVYDYANVYAKNFNEMLQEAGYFKRISFPRPELIYIKNLNWYEWLFSKYFTEGDYMCAQKYLKGNYIKWTNNNGYTTQDPLAETFQHYTYIKSGKQGICCDLQGVKDGYQYFLTDPAVNSIDRLFGDTDMGIEGMKNILQRHKCNQICEKIGLTKNKQYNPKLKPIEYSTTHRRSFSYEI